MKPLRAIMYNDSIIDFKGICYKNKIKYTEWTSNTDEYEVRVDMCDLNQDQLNALVDFIGSKDLLNYTYIIVWEQG